MRTHTGTTLSQADRPLVLIVDDSVDVVRLLALILAETCDVIFATSGAQGLELARARLPALVLLDLEMPGLDGRAVWQLLREGAATRAIPVVFVSAEDPRHGPPADPDLQSVGWIAKPFSGLDVQAAVRARLAGETLP